MFLLSPISFPNLGITVDPNPVAFTVFGKDIYWYGIIIALGFLLAVIYMMRRAPVFGLTQDDVLDEVLWAVPIGVICARLYYCIFYWELYADNPISILYIWEGGLAIYGGDRRCDHHSCGEQGEKDQDGHDAGHCGDGRIDRSDLRALGQLYEPRGAWGRDGQLLQDGPHGRERRGDVLPSDIFI